eukprot:Filipodium_phascolosomae@DN5740_c0_g1_i1.p1
MYAANYGPMEPISEQTSQSHPIDESSVTPGAPPGDNPTTGLSGVNKRLYLEGCQPWELKAIAKDYASSVIGADVEMHRRLSNLVASYEESLRLIDEAAYQNSADDMQPLIELKPNLSRRVEHLRRVQAVLDDVPIPESVPCSTKERSVSLRARTMCNMRQADTQYKFSEKFGKFTGGVRSTSQTVVDWFKARQSQGGQGGSASTGSMRPPQYQ